MDGKLDVFIPQEFGSLMVIKDFLLQNKAVQNKAVLYAAILLLISYFSYLSHHQWFVFHLHII